jgi:anti-anti-sigma factor
VDFEAEVNGDDEIRLAGEFDLAAVKVFEDVAASAWDGQRELILDLADVRFIDSSGIRAILSLAMAARDKGVVLRNPQGAVRRLIALTDIEGRAGIRIEG